MAELFVENKNGYNEVNHIDFNRQNCNANNLEWCTHIQNIHYSSSKGRYKTDLKQGSFNGRAILDDDRVREIKKMIKQGFSNIVIANKFNVKPSTIWNIKSGNTWKNVK